MSAGTLACHRRKMIGSSGVRTVCLHSKRLSAKMRFLLDTAFHSELLHSNRSHSAAPIWGRRVPTPSAALAACSSVGTAHCGLQT